MNDDTTWFGTEPHKLHRKDSGNTSIEAANKVDSTSWEEKVFNFISSKGKKGCTQNEVVYHYKDKRSTVSARFAALKEKKLILDTGLIRNGSKVVADYKYKKRYKKTMIHYVKPKTAIQIELEKANERLKKIYKLAKKVDRSKNSSSFGKAVIKLVEFSLSKECKE